MSVESPSREASERPVRDELRRIASDTAFAVRLAAGRVELPPATPSDGPDPYGNPDPDWLRIDWREHRREIDVVGATANYVEMGEGTPSSSSTASRAAGRTGSSRFRTSPAPTG